MQAWARQPPPELLLGILELWFQSAGGQTLGVAVLEQREHEAVSERLNSGSSNKSQLSVASSSGK